MKKDRQARIIELIENQNIETQEDLAQTLRKEGFEVTQATISRDIRKLNLTKVALGNGHQKYAVIKNEGTYAEKYIRILKESYLSVDIAQNMLVLKTVAGMAMAAAAAFDHMQMPGFVGCIAGDDTVMIAVRTSEEARVMMKNIKDIVQ